MNSFSATQRNNFMSKRIITTTSAPAAVGPYSQAVQSGDFLFCSGQIPLDPTTGEIVGADVTEQTTRVLENLKGLLESQKLTLNDVVKTTVFLTDLANFQAMNAVYSTYFTSDPPARSTIQVSALPKGASVEIEATAKIGE
jgi:2-iminobutanoate/2-iminopropanoate deaminase